MRRYFLLISTIILLSSLTLLFYFKYSGIIVLYHLIIMLTGQVIAYSIGFVLLFPMKNQKFFKWLLHAMGFLNFFFLIQLYIMIISSNYFWKKTITLSVIKNYFFKFGNFVSSLPIESWIFYGFFTLIIVLSVVLYYLFRPHSTYLYQACQRLRTRKFILKSAMGTGMALLILFVFKTQVMHAKRIMHFAEEPVLQFFLGNMWGHGNEMAFDKQRYLLGEKDNLCLDSLHIKPRAEEQTVLFIVVDALRSDHLSMYGYNRNTTPFLDSLYKAKQLFSVAHNFSPSTNTVGGVAGLFFSRDWTEFGYNGLNLMKYLKKANYTTYAFLTGYHRDWFGLSALYRGSSDFYYESPQDPEVPPDDDLVTLQKIIESPIRKRSFSYIHLLSTHTIGKKDPSFQQFLPNKMGFGIDQKTALVNNYDNGILQADYVIRSIFDKLKREGLLTNSIIYILADHGELFGEDGRWSHGGSVHQNLISVPLLIYDSKQEWYVNREAATLKDLGPTIVNRLNYPIPACWEGRSLHLPVQNFSMQIGSVIECDFPHGVVSRQGNQYQLQVMDAKREIKKTAIITNGTWQEVKAP